jgi:hypothetical protein
MKCTLVSMKNAILFRKVNRENSIRVIRVKIVRIFMLKQVQRRKNWRKNQRKLKNKNKNNFNKKQKRTHRKEIYKLVQRN